MEKSKKAQEESSEVENTTYNKEKTGMITISSSETKDEVHNNSEERTISKNREKAQSKENQRKRCEMDLLT